jgi:hypothetical protein
MSETIPRSEEATGLKLASEVEEQAARERRAYAKLTRRPIAEATLILEARGLLRAAMAIIDGGRTPIGSATGRVADALGLLGKIEPDAPGVSRLTGRGNGLKTLNGAAR